jgi:4-hydroxy-tetrahydrodipicolinate synthase
MSAMQLNKTHLTGLFTALVTPYDADGEVDRAAVARIVRHQLDGGASGLVPIGGTGEYAMLSPDQRIQMVEATVEAAAGRVPVVPGVLATGFSDALEAGESFKAAGASGVMLVTPYYATGTQAAIREYYRSYRDALDLPVLAYEIPRRTNVALEAETVQAMAEDGSIIGMKYSSYDVPQFIRAVSFAGERIAIMSGEEPLFATHIAIGATGGVLATANLYPRIWCSVFELARKGDLKAALKLQMELDPLLAAVFAETNPGPLKHAMKMAGFNVGAAKLPLTPPTAETIARLKMVMPRIAERERSFSAAA